METRLIGIICNTILKAIVELLKRQPSLGLLAAISHEILVRNHSEFDTKCPMG